MSMTAVLGWEILVNVTLSRPLLLPSCTSSTRTDDPYRTGTLKFPSDAQAVCSSTHESMGGNVPLARSRGFAEPLAEGLGPPDAGVPPALSSSASSSLPCQASSERSLIGMPVLMSSSAPAGRRAYKRISRLCSGILMTPDNRGRLSSPCFIFPIARHYARATSSQL